MDKRSKLPNTTDYKLLFNQLLKGELSPTDAELLVSWLGSEELDPEAAQLLATQLKLPATDKLHPEIIAALEARLPLILNSTPERQKVHLLNSRWFKYAAAVFILCFGLGLFLVVSNKKAKQEDNVVRSNPKIDIAPGKEGAVLTLDDGRTIVLDSMQSGLVANQDGSKVMLKDGKLVYDINGNLSAKTAYNLLVTPKGRQFQIVLPDGSKAWLNAASSLRYPTIFAGKERNVEVSGEVYFEVAKNAKMPFKVKVNNETEIEVLGTHFNINSYNNEQTINTTLLEGSVVVRNKGQQVTIKPGEQAQVGSSLATNRSQQINVTNNINLEKIMAWKNGLFDFQDATLEEVMHQLERWYDIEVVYEKGIPKLEFIGKMGRDLSLADVLHVLEGSKVHSRLMEGRKLVIMP